MLLEKIFLTVVSVIARLFLSYSEPAPIKPLSGYAREVAHNALYSGQEMRVHPDHAGTKDVRFRWYKYPANGEVPYVIDGSLNDLKEVIIDAMDQFHEDTCIRFVPWSNQKNYIHIKKGEGCWSFVGKQLKPGPQIVSLGEGCEDIGTVCHVLGHTIGLLHEHQRSDRDKYIQVYRQNVQIEFLGQLNRTNPNDEIISTIYDPTSIMHYGNYAYSKKYGELKTMESKNGVTLLEPYDQPGLNKLDIDKVNALYKCKN